MPGLVTKSVEQEQQEQRVKIRTAVKRIAGFIVVATTGAVFATLAAAALFAQGKDNDKYLLKSPGGIAFSDFKGYEDWSVVSSAHTDEVLKVIVGNPAVIKAYKAGVPGNGQPFPDGSMLVKLQWKPKKSTDAPFVVDVPDVLSRLSSWKRTVRDFRRVAGGDTRCSTTMPHRTSSHPIPKASPIAEMRATRP